jgi:hypothetical protein
MMENGPLTGGEASTGVTLTIRNLANMRGSSPARPKLMRNAVMVVPTVRRIAVIKPPSQGFLLSWAAIVENFQVNISLSIYCSNAIENVGSTFSMTYRFCKAVFAGDWPYIDYIEEQDKKYADETAKLKEIGRETDRLTIIQSCREIAQHAVAMKLLFNLLVVENHPLNEDIIKYAHQLLMMYSEHEDTGRVYRIQRR